MGLPSDPIGLLLHSLDGRQLKFLLSALASFLLLFLLQRFVDYVHFCNFKGLSSFLAYSDIENL